MRTSITPAEQAQIAALGRTHNDHRGALEALNRGLTPEEYRRDMAMRAQRSKLLDVDLGSTPYSVVDALRAALEGTRSLAVEQSDELFKQSGAQRQHAHAIAVPLSMLGFRAASSTASTGAHLVEMPAAYMGALGPSLNCVRAGAREIGPISGNLKLGYAADVGEGQLPAEGGALSPADDELVFSGAATLQPRAVRSSCTFSKELLYSSMPSVDELLADALRRRLSNKLEKQLIFGDPDSNANDLRGVLATDGVTDLSSDFDTLTHAHILDGVQALDDQYGLGDAQVSVLTTRRVVNLGLRTLKESEINQQLFEADRTTRRRWLCDDLHVYAGQQLGPIANMESPVEIIDHVAVLGDFSRMIIGYHGVLQLIPNVFGLNAEYGVCKLLASLDVSCSLMPEAFAFTRLPLED